MKDIIHFRDLQQERLRAHPFYSWLASSALPLGERLRLAPIMALFVMNFRDMNKWVLRFDDERDDYRKVLNGSTLEDETHSRLFLADWRKMQLDDHLGWPAGETIWWLFLAPETEPFRGYGFDFMRLTVDDGGDPKIRFAHSEAGEACGHVFFEHLAPLADQLGRETGLAYRYFGGFHLALESGHVLESEGVFEDLPLGEDERRLGIALAERMFRIFDGMHDCFYAYARDYIEARRVPRFSPAPLPPLEADALPARPVPGQRLHASQELLEQTLERRMAQTAGHPFYAWLRAENGVSALHKLRRFIPMWLMDIMGYRDLNRYVFRYAQPQDAWEHSVNDWVADLETHNVLFLNDWRALNMDEVLRWSASETLEFCFFDPGMDVHRRNIIAFAKLGLENPDPILRLWLMEALEASGHAFFATTKAVAERAERDSGVRLDYLGDRHELAHPAHTGLPPARPQFKGETIDAGQQRRVLEFIDTVFDAVDEQLSLSLEVARLNKFAVR